VAGAERNLPGHRPSAKHPPAIPQAPAPSPPRQPQTPADAANKPAVPGAQRNLPGRGPSAEHPLAIPQIPAPSPPRYPQTRAGQALSRRPGVQVAQRHRQNPEPRGEGRASRAPSAQTQVEGLPDAPAKSAGPRAPSSSSRLTSSTHRDPSPRRRAPGRPCLARNPGW
jgi:hypothetical protein